MLPTTILTNEHKVIKLVLSCLEKMTDRYTKNRKIDVNEAIRIIDFIRNFADRSHHMKEEDHLFRMMNERGFPMEQGPVAVMLMDHEQGRRYVKGMEEAAKANETGDPGAIELFAENSYGYVNLLRAHIQKEDGVLYPMANRAFTEEDQKKLMKCFEEVERDEIGQEIHEKYIKFAEDLASRYHVNLEEIETKENHVGFCCGH